ncbi:MAG: hypothetical protein L3J30_01405 [Marinosulfonomonas sp.]|nr:hypothetical protein [Marinosulfonomonas sp.]
MTYKCKRIIDGKTYNTETATQIEGNRQYGEGVAEDGVWGKFLYQTRFGAFFELRYAFGVDEDNFEIITPFMPAEAQKWLEENASWRPELIEALFGEMPEAGAGEVKYTLRLPESLRNKLAACAKENNQ